MMRLPFFRYHAPTSVEEAAKMLADDPSAKLLAGGTDLLPNMKRRQQTPKTLIALKNIGALKEIQNGSGLTIGAATTLTNLCKDARVQEHYTALFQAAVQVASPHLRNSATLGGNLCLDTRCHYYDQNWEWRKSIDFCMKKDGDVCWVAPASKRCLAVSSTDAAPALIALGAHINLHSAKDGTRTVALADLYQNDGIDYMARRPDEILTEIKLEDPKGWKSSYWKLRRRGSFDFPVLGAAAAVKLNDQGIVKEARIVLGAVASWPIVCKEAAESLIDQPLTDAAIAEAGAKAGRKAKPMDNTDFTLHWRKRVASEFVAYALRELRGDDLTQIRKRVARHELIPPI